MELFMPDKSDPVRYSGGSISVSPNEASERSRRAAEADRANWDRWAELSRKNGVTPQPHDPTKTTPRKP